MAEEIASGAAEAADPAGVALALTGASRAEADAYLRDQRHHMHEQLNQLHLDIWEKRIGMMLRLMTLAVGLAAVIGLLIAMWNASQADGLVVDAFSVPPSLAASGLGGDTLSQDITDRVNVIRDRATARSLSTSKSASQEGGDEVKVEIPETGVSLTQAWRYLKLWLGNERHVRGSMRPDGDGRIRMTVTLEGEPPASFAGPVGDLDKIEEQAAEHIYGGIEPINYVIYLQGNHRFDEALAALPAVISSARTPEERAENFAVTGDFIKEFNGDFALSLARARIARSGAPKRFSGYIVAARADTVLRHDEDRFRQAVAILALKEQDQLGGVQGQGWAKILTEARVDRALMQGDGSALAGACALYCPAASVLVTDVQAAEIGHDPKAGRARIAEALAVGGNGQQVLANVRYRMDVLEGDWQAALHDADGFLTAAATEDTIAPGYRTFYKTNLGEPWLAEAKAHTGDMAGAQALIASTPLDCDDCVLARGRIAALNQDWTGAARWFAMVSARSPDIPFADADWGAMLLASGDAAGAIVKFQSANRKGPHFADPLEGWGEALMAKKQSHLALAKFKDAEKYAPNWGRLHLKWGEALYYAGKHDEAKAQFALAAQLDLTPSEKVQLNKFSIDHI